VSDPWPIPDSTDSIERPICCPICGGRLDEIVLARADDEYFCPGVAPNKSQGGIGSSSMIAR
jgi:hypothetical protein